MSTSYQPSSKFDLLERQHREKIAAQEFMCTSISEVLINPKVVTLTNAVGCNR